MMMGNVDSLILIYETFKSILHSDSHYNMISFFSKLDEHQQNLG